MTVKSALRDLNNAVLDLQSADYNTYERPLERLAQTLNGSDLAAITSDLRAAADFDAFLERANQGGSMMGSARLNWPASRKEELGLVIHIIERGAAAPDWFLNFSHTYYYSGSKFVANIRKITAAVIIPFNRDFAVYVEEHAHGEPFQDAKSDMATEEDKKDLLQALFQLGQGGKRPSIQDAAIKYFPEWNRDRLTNVAEALFEEGSVLNPTGAMLYVDLSSSADLPPAEWPRDYDSLDHERDIECRARSTSRKRSSASCVKLRLCWRRERARLKPAAGSRSASRPIIGGARSMAA